jgi:hypothetical protein
MAAKQLFRTIARQAPNKPVCNGATHAGVVYSLGMLYGGINLSRTDGVKDNLIGWCQPLLLIADCQDHWLRG